MLFCHFISVRYSVLKICVIWAKENKAWVSSGYVKAFFTIYGQLKMPFCQFRKFDFFEIKMTFAESLVKSLVMTDFQNSY